MSVQSKPIDQIIKNTGVKFSSHDLRRTFMTIAETKCGLPMTVIKTLVNHVTDSDETMGYIRHDEPTIRESLDKIESYIAKQIKPDSQNVSQFKATSL